MNWVSKSQSHREIFLGFQNFWKDGPKETPIQTSFNHSEYEKPL